MNEQHTNRDMMGFEPMLFHQGRNFWTTELRSNPALTASFRPKKGVTKLLKGKLVDSVKI